MSITNIFEKVKTGYSFCNKWSFEILLVGCLIFIVIFGIYHKFKKARGTWNTKLPVFPKMTNGKLFSTRRRKYINPVSSGLRKKSKDSKGEEECRKCLQHLFGRPFNKDRPDFLRNEVTGGTHNLEIDCFDKDLKLGVEYQGQQHYKFIPFFHKNKEAFLNQKYRDYMKRQICRDNGINLIEVPYDVKIDKIFSFIREECIRLGYKV